MSLIKLRATDATEIHPENSGGFAEKVKTFMKFSQVLKYEEVSI